ncbi:MAG TPA: ATP-binding protein [Steroidobacteraceae bacterium]|nr:ATP-binding protein [Steroidobacteraceae bacterium]
MATSSLTIPLRAETALHTSLRGRLLALLLAMTVGLWAVSGVIIYIEFNKEGRQYFDESLAEAGALLLSLAEHEIREHGPGIGAELMRAESQHNAHELAFQIWTEDHRAAYRTSSAPERPFVPLDASGFGWSTVNGKSMRTYATWNDSRTLQIQLAEPLTRRADLSAWTYAHLTILALLLLPLAMLLIWWILTRSLSPLRRLAGDVALRSPDDLQPVTGDDAPSEVAPLVDAMNRLFARVRDALQMERRFTADAAHELRSPLAAIRANAQVMSAARSPDELHEAAADLLASVDRSTRLVDQLLVLARIDGTANAAPELSDVDLSQLAAEECSRMRPLANRRNTQIVLHAAPAVARGESSLLAVLLRNLIDNAVRYSPEGSHVTVSAGPAEEGGARVRVTDEGPGIPAAERERIYERFYRALGNEATGSGLGLSIVRRICALHGASVETDEGPDGRGTCFTVRFPAPRVGGT